MAAAAAEPSSVIFNGLLDDEDDLTDHDEDDSSSSAAAAAAAAAAALDRAPLSISQVTIAVPDLHLQHHVTDSKRPVPGDESRKLFQRLWTDEDEIELLQGFLDYTTRRGSSQQYHDTSSFYDQIKTKLQFDFNKNQLVEKLRRLKKKYRNLVTRFSSGKDYIFKSPHDQATFEISSKIWGNAAVNANGSAAFRGAALEDDDDDLNNPNFFAFQRTVPGGVEVNNKSPASRKRNLSGSMKSEEKPPLHNSGYSNINILQTPPAMATPIAAPVLNMGFSGPMSNVIEETVKSCLSPILKELLPSSTGSNAFSSGLCCGHAFGPGSPISLCYPGTVPDKTADERWRKQQILELEVFSKRLELVQDQIREQLKELRSMGN